MARTFVLALLVVGAPLFAQVGEVGSPLVSGFTPEQYDGSPQVFDAAQGADGILQLACPSDFSLLRYDGERWSRTPLDRQILSLDLDGEGRTWLGCRGDFGYLLESEEGGEFVSVAEGRLEAAFESSSFVGTHCTPEGVFFLSLELLVLWDGAACQAWPAPENGGFMDVAVVGTDVFVLEGERGLLVLAEGELLESEALGEERIPFHGIGSDGERLVGTWLDEEGLNWVELGGEPRPPLAIPELLRGPTYISDVLITPGGGLAVSTASGILFLDSAGDFQSWLDVDNGLPNSLVYSMHLDRDGAVWACLAYGLARIDPSPSASFFGPELGLVGTPLSLTRYLGRIYCGTFAGLFRLSENEGRAHFDLVAGAPVMPIFALESSAHGLLLGTELGLFALGGEKPGWVSSDQPLALASLVMKADEPVEAVAVAGFDDLRILRWDGRGWSFEESMPVSWETDEILFGGQGLWLHTTDRELLWLPLDGSLGEVTRIAGEWLGMCGVPGCILAWNRERSALFAGASPDPELHTGLEWASFYEDERWAMPCVDASGRLWRADRRALRRLGGDLLSGLEETSDLAWASPLALEGLWFDETLPDVVWLHAREGLLRLDTEALRAPPRRTPGVRCLALVGEGAWDTVEAGSSLPAGGSLRLEVAAVVFGGSATEYRYRLGGLENEFGAWTSHPLKEYASLPGGDYEFSVEARSGGEILGIGRFPFRVRSPWYLTWPVIAGEVLLFGAAGLGFLRWRSRRLRRENERLGRMVSERTQDLEEQKRRVLERTDELQEVNQRLVHEITAREAADRQQHEMHLRLEEAERFESLGALAGGIAHDFNNYLTSIQGYAELALAEGGERERLGEYLRNVTTVSSQAAELCSGLVSLAGPTPLKTVPVDLSQLIRGMEALLRTSVKDRGELRLELADSLPVVDADPSHLRRALVNLTVNAAEASAGRNSLIAIRSGTIRCSDQDLQRMHGAGERKAGLYVYVEVEDRGAGLSKDSLHRIFDPFYSTKFVGRGLGLSTVFNIQSSHRGAIDVRSEVGEGTCVRLLFPEASGVASASTGAFPAESRVRLRGRALVVDDDPQVRRLTETFCRRLGLEVLGAANGFEALEAIEKGPSVDAVLLDLSMPGMGGLEVLASIRRLRGDLPVLIVSGYSDHVPHGVLDEATLFLAKPFSLKALGEFLGRAMQGAPR